MCACCKLDSIKITLALKSKGREATGGVINKGKTETTSPRFLKNYKFRIKFSRNQNKPKP